MYAHFKTKLKPISTIVLGTLVLSLGYQNCSKLNLTDLEALAKEAEAERLRIGKDDETVVIGLNKMPDLKMYFVVDNSGTMKQNQLNLSDSFGAMFDSGSADSLSKFDTTAALVSTAQKSPSFTAERGTLDKIADQQKNFSDSLAVTENTYLTSLRTAELNLGTLPGDNIGYHLKKSADPLKFEFAPAPVLGADNNNGQVTFKQNIRKLASENPAVLEFDFKSRLAVLNSDRIPVEIAGGKALAQHANVVDSESGLCSVARILRNDQNIKAGDLLSFTIVTDEDDNDPQGLNCIQSVTEFTGAEDLVDGTCTERKTSFSYQTTSSSQAPDKCTLVGNLGYKFKLSYPATSISTKIEYRYVKQAAQYSAAYTQLDYMADNPTYRYLHTEVKYFYKDCIDQWSDGIKVGQICTNKSETKLKAGNFVNQCLTLAKSFNSAAINETGYTPTCTSRFENISSACSTSDPLCERKANTSPKSVNNLIGSFDAAKCLNQAKTYPDYSPGTTATCKLTPKTVTACSPAETAAGCDLVSAVEYGWKTETPSTDYTTTSTGCLNWAKSRSGNAVVDASHIRICEKQSTPYTATHTSTILTFAEAASVDNGATLAVNAVCGDLAAKAIAKAKLSNSSIPDSSQCVITGYQAAGSKDEAVTSNCDQQASNRCSAENLRQCSGTLIVAPVIPVTNSPLVFKEMQEELKCDSLCSSSKLGFCSDASSQNITIAQYIKEKVGPTATCVPSTTDVGTKEIKQAQFASNTAAICESTPTGVPRYFAKTKGPYRTKRVDVEYVAGTKQDENGKSVPAKDLVTYIEERSKEIANGSTVFSALIRRATDPLGTGGSYGTAYENLIQRTNGTAGSVLSNDYSVILKDFSRIIKNNIIRTVVLNKMKAHQIIMKVLRVKETGETEMIDHRLWVQNGATLVLDPSIELKEGDQFKVEFQNVLE